MLKRSSRALLLWPKLGRWISRVLFLMLEFWESGWIGAYRLDIVVGALGAGVVCSEGRV